MPMAKSVCIRGTALCLVLFLTAGLMPFNGAEACTSEPPADMCDRQVLCGINVPSLRPIPLSSRVEGERAVRVTIPLTLFYETYDRASCYDCAVQHTGGSIGLTIDCNEVGAAPSPSLIKGVEVPFDSLCCGSNTGVAEVDFIIPRSGPLALSRASLFEGGACRITGLGRVELDDNSKLEVACNEQVVSIVQQSNTDSEKPMIQLQTSNAQGEERLGPQIVSAGSAPRGHVTVTNESPYAFDGRIQFSSLNSNSIATCTGPSTTFTTAGGNGDAFTSTANEKNRCDEPPDPSNSVNPRFDIQGVRVMPGESITYPYWVRIWPGCFFGSASQITACLTGQFGGELEGKYREMCVTVPVIVDYQSPYCEGDDWHPSPGSPGSPSSGGSGDDTPPADSCTSDWDLVGMAPCGPDTTPCNALEMKSSEDWDNDGLSNIEERFIYFTNPDEADTDRDGLDDQVEIELGIDPNRADTDGDGLIDGREQEVGSSPTNQDTDGDTLSDWAEVNIIDGTQTDPTLADTDGDTWPDGLEARDPNLDPLSANPSLGGNAGRADSDGDGLLDSEERNNRGNVDMADTDGDGLSDGFEVYVSQTSPAVADSDSDGIDDGEEVTVHFSNPNELDSDADGLPDFAEVTEHLSSPTRADTDRDGIEDLLEVEMFMTDPADADSDDGGADDGREIELGLDPNDPADDQGVLNPQRGMVYLTEETGEARPVVTLQESAPDIDVADVFRSGQTAGGYQGRIQETWRLGSPETARNTTIQVNGRLNYAVLNGGGGHAVGISELEMGVKPMDRSEDAPMDLSNTFVGEGRIRLSVQPAVDVLAFHQVGVWVTGGAVVGRIKARLNTPVYRVMGDQVEFSFELVLPDVDFSRIQLSHDFRALQRFAFETECRDGEDGDNDGAIDCADSDCDMDPFCQPEDPDAGIVEADLGGADGMTAPADMGVMMVPDGSGGQGGGLGSNQDTDDTEDSGCACDASTSQGMNPFSLVYLSIILFGFSRRRRTP